MKKIKTKVPKFRVGQMVGDRLVVEVLEDEYTKSDFRYGYRYVVKDWKSDIGYCSESTLSAVYYRS
jgi:hypothetical protein